MARIIKITGAVIELQPTGSKEIRKQDIAYLVGGTPRRINLPTGGVMFINDNQTPEKRRLNGSASSIFTGMSAIYGDVVYCGTNDIKNIKDE